MVEHQGLTPDCALVARESPRFPLTFTLTDRLSPDVVAKYPGLAPTDRGHTSQHVEQSRLPGPVVSEDGCDLSRVNIKTHVINGHHSRLAASVEMALLVKGSFNLTFSHPSSHLRWDPLKNLVQKWRGGGSKLQTN